METQHGWIIQPGMAIALAFLTLLFLPAAELDAQEPEASTKNSKVGVEESAPTARPNLINESLLAGLPLNGRSYTQLVTLEAGVSDPSSASSSRGVSGGGLTFSGSRSSSNSFLLDGTNIMDSQNRMPRSAAGVQLGSDSVLQVQVFSANYGPEYGRNNGGVMNSITRSGSNEFHGTFFEYFRNSRLDARNFFDRGPNPPPFKRNQFGFTLSGPVRKGKTYFMVSSETLRDRLNETKVDNFLDAEARQGIITDASGRPIRTVIVNPRVKPYLDPKVMPLPNSIRVGGGFAQNSSPQFLPTNENFFTVRLDHQLSERDSLFGRYTFDDAVSHRGQDTFAFGVRSKSRQQYLTLAESHIFSPSLLASSRLGYTRPVSYSDSVSSIDIPRSMFFVQDAPHFGQIAIPGAAPFGPAGYMPSGDVTNSFQFSGDVLAQRQKHGMKFGVEVHRYRWDIYSNSSSGGSWAFNSVDSFLEGGLEGTSLTVALPGSSSKKAYREALVGLYGQDDYKLRPSLQLNLGLRYEVATLIRDRFGRDSFLADPLRDTEVKVGPVLKNNPSLGNFSPRLGMVWSPERSRNTTVNAGFGIYYDQLMAAPFDTLKSGLPFYRIASRTNFDSSKTFPNAVLAATEAGVPLQAQNLDYLHTKSPTVLRYNLAVQQRLGKDSNVQVGYVGARGNHLLRNYEANLFPVPIRRPDGALFFPPGAGPVNPAFGGGITLMSSDAQSFYNSLLISADARPNRSLSLRASYTYSKSVDDASSFNFSSERSQQYGPMRTLDRGLSDYDIRHRSTINFFYSLPSGSGISPRLIRVLSPILGSWRAGGIVGLRSGLPTTPQINVRRPGYLFAATRPNLLPGQNNNPTHGVSIGCKDPVTGATVVEAGQKLGGPSLFFDPCVFSVPDAGTLGNLGRNTLIGPSVFNMDVSLQREFPLGNGRRLQFRAEFFNVTNHPTFRTPATGSSVVFTGLGRFNPTAWRYTATATTARQTQFALRFSF
jgi:hypothetical protein